MGKIKCRKCLVEYEYDDKYYDFVIWDKISVTLNLDKISYADSELDYVYIHLMDFLKKHSIRLVKKHKIEVINQESILECPNCKNNEVKYYYVSFGSNFNWFLHGYLLYKVNYIMKQEIKKDTKYFFEYDYWDESVIESVISNLPLKYYYERKYLLKLQKVRKILPIDREYGGDGDTFNFINWLIYEINKELFGIILAMFIGGGVTVLKRLFKGYRVKKIINKKIKTQSDFWKDISMDDIKNYMKIPKDYKFSKEQLIKKIVKIKTKEYEEELIEKFRY